MLLLAGQVALGLVIAASTALLIVHLHAQALAQADHEQSSLALVLTNQAERAFEAIELVQTAIVDRVHSDNISTPTAFREQMSTTHVHEQLRRRGIALPQLDAISISDAKGNLINSSRLEPWPLPPINVSDRDFFQNFNDHPDLTTFVSEPVQTYMTGKWTLYIARKVTNADGDFLGVILAALELTYFEEFYRSVIPAADSAIALFRLDGRLLARYPHTDLSVGHSFTTSFPLAGLPATGAPSVAVRKVSQLDGIDRLITARPLGHYPVAVAVANSISSVLGEWRKQALYLVGSGVFLELMVAATGMVILRQLRSQRLLIEAQAATREAEIKRNSAEAELALAHERERATRVLDIQNVRFGAALSNMSQALCMVDASGTLVVANDQLTRMFGVAADSIAPGVTIENLLGTDPGGSNLQPSDRESMLQSLQKLKANNAPANVVRELADGRVLAVAFVPMEDKGWLVTLEDITEQRQVAARITHMAHHDALTGLPNRVLFHNRLDEAMARSRRGEPCAVLYLDLDHFKSVNDTLGHPIGDALLRSVTQRLLSTLRETDTVARLGGDEFAIVQSSVDQPSDATVLAKRLIEV